MALDPTWQIIPPGGTVPVVASTLGITEITGNFRSLTPDTVTLTVDGRNVDAAALFAYGSTVTILRVVTTGNATTATQWFVGRVTRTPATGSGSAESQSYTLSGPWWYLDNLTYRQQWTFPGIGATESFIGRLILGQGLDGTLIPTGAVITELLQYAIDAGVPFQIGAVPSTGVLATEISTTILTGFLIPLDEVKDVTCTEAFRKMAHWHPDAVAWFDYTTTPPTLYFRSPGDGGLATATLTKGVPPLVSIGQITPRPELQAPAVVIHYEVTTTNNGAASSSISTDVAFVSANGILTGAEALAVCADPGKLFCAVVLTIPLRGQSSTTVQQRVNTVAIKDTVGVSGLVDYLAGKSIDLAADVNNPSITADGITITACSRTITNPSVDAYNAATGEYGAQGGYDDSLAYELVNGAITEWMAQQYAIKTQEQMITFSYTADASASGGDQSLIPKTVSFPLKATNASGQVYTSLTSYNAGDAPPSGLAAFYLKTISALQWSGSVELVEQAAGASVPAALGCLLNIAGSANAAWATMNALIVGVEMQASTGRTTLTFGPKPHLKAQEMWGRLQLTRPGGLGGRESGGALGTDSSAARSTGNSGGDTVPGSTEFPIKGGGSRLSGPGAAAPNTPFSFAQTAANTNSFLLNQDSYLREDASSNQNTGMTNSTTALAFSDGDIVYLRLDGSSDGSSLDEASIVKDQAPPFGPNGEVILTANVGTADSPQYVWDYSLVLLAQVFAADSSGQATRGGIVYTVDTQTPPTKIEVVQQTSTHLAMELAFSNGVPCYSAFPNSAPLLS